MQNWEYEAVQLKGDKDKDMIPLLEEKGGQGWELVSVVVSPVPIGNRIEYLAFLKRPLEESAQ